MPIKKSSLEEKWYYRAAKIFFIIFGVIIALLLLLRRRIYVCYAPIESDLNLWFFVAIGLCLYFLLLTLTWRIIIYVVFGGLEDDLKKDGPRKSDSSAGQFSSENRKANQAAIIPLVIFIIILFIVFLASRGHISLPKINLSSGDASVKTSTGYTCPATSAQTETPCHSVKGDIGVEGIIVPVDCPCPSDTVFRQMDNITAGGPYRICECKE